MTYDAACLCEATRYQVDGPLDEVAVCHCSQCRRATGSAVNVAVPVSADQVRWIARDRISEFESSPGKFRAFCGGCGAQVYSRLADDPSRLRLRGGLIAGLEAPANVYNIWWESRWQWIDTLLDRPRYPGNPEDGAPE